MTKKINIFDTEQYPVVVRTRREKYFSGEIDEIHLHIDNYKCITIRVVEDYIDEISFPGGYIKQGEVGTFLSSLAQIKKKYKLKVKK